MCQHVARLFLGNNCEIEVNECLSQPCQNGGSCIDELDSFSCQCPHGITGISYTFHPYYVTQCGCIWPGKHCNCCNDCNMMLPNLPRLSQLPHTSLWTICCLMLLTQDPFVKDRFSCCSSKDVTSYTFSKCLFSSASLHSRTAAVAKVSLEMESANKTTSRCQITEAPQSPFKSYHHRSIWPTVVE